MSLTSCELCTLYQDCETIVECGCLVDNVVESAIMHTYPKNYECDEEALRRDIKEYKELLWAIKDENTLLKVKNRRLEDILKKKNKIVDSHYLGTHNKILFKETVHQFTHRIEALQSENEELKQELNDKESMIRKLRKTLSTCSAYKPAPRRVTSKKKITSASTSGSMGSRTSRATVRSQDQESTGTEEITEELLKIKLKDISDTNTEGEHDTDRAVSCSLLLDTPHEEIEKLHSGFKDILSEVGKLKDSVGEMHDQHARAVCEMRMREKELMARIQDKEEEFAYRNIRKQASRGVTVDTDRPRLSKTASRKATSVFARILPAHLTKSPSKQQKGKRNGLAIRTASKNVLHDETDMRLYIDEVLTEMNRQK